jgi:hypothetical protein
MKVFGFAPGLNGEHSCAHRHPRFQALDFRLKIRPGSATVYSGFELKIFRHIILALFLTGAVAFAEGAAATPPAPLPSVAEILRKVVARAKWVDQQGDHGQYSYDEVKVTEDLADDGTVKKKKEQIFHIAPIAGILYARMTKTGGKPLTGKDLKAEDDLEKKFRSRLANPKTAAEEKRKNLQVNDELLSRYTFSLIGHDTIDGRDAYLIRFSPKSPSPPEKDMLDRFLNKMAGRVWVDSVDFEAARIEIELQETVDIWVGLVGSLKKLALTIEQRRMPDGLWVPAGSNGEIQSRKFLSSSRTRFREQPMEYKKPE